MFLVLLAVVFDQSIEARYQVDNEDLFGAAPTGNAPTTSESSNILFNRIKSNSVLCQLNDR